MKSKSDSHAAIDPQSDAGSQSERSVHDDWHQLETFVDHLQELARAPIAAEDFYRELLDGCVTLLAAEGGAIWQMATNTRWATIHQINLDQMLIEGSDQRDRHDELLASIATGRVAKVVHPHSDTSHHAENPTAAIAVLAPVTDTIETTGRRSVHAVLELFHRPGRSPEVQRGWRELLETVAIVAADFHMHQQLRSLQTERGLYDRSLSLMRRLQRSTDLRQTAYEIVNEGRRFVEADRLSLVVKRGSAWQVLAASGVERVESRADVTKRLQELACTTSAWGEPVEYSDALAGEHELPPKLASVLSRHVDESESRKLVATTVQSRTTTGDVDSQPRRIEAVLVAEQFTSDDQGLSAPHVLELALLCEPALRQAIEMDRFPMRSCLRWADRWERVRDRWGITKITAGLLASLAVVAALTFVKVDYEVEASATLHPVVQRDVFATADGKVTDVRIAHGEQVQAGDVLAALHDPQLSLEVQRVEGEIATTRKRLEAIAVVRTDRQVREELGNDKLPLSAEAEQLEKQLVSLQTQLKILSQRRDALTLRSPISGKVLTLDVQNMLQSRPVQRGQVLFTVADTSAGWRLTAEVAQDRIGHVVEANRRGKDRSDDATLPVRFRLAGETDQTYTGHVATISTAAVIDTDDLDQPSSPFEVHVDIDQSQQLPGRPGMTAQAKIHCGQRSLGYVWLHDIWENVYGWLVF